MDFKGCLIPSRNIIEPPNPNSKGRSFFPKLIFRKLNKIDNFQNSDRSHHKSLIINDSYFFFQNLKKGLSIIFHVNTPIIIHANVSICSRFEIFVRLFSSIAADIVNKVP